MNERSEASPIEILLVEDDPGDALITREALEHSKVLNHLQCLANGEEANFMGAYWCYPRTPAWRSPVFEEAPGRTGISGGGAASDLPRIPLRPGAAPPRLHANA